VVELMHGEDTKKKEGHYRLPSTLKHCNLTMALGELKCKWKEYFVIFFVFVFSSFLILLPMNMKTTVENPSFMTYMGVGESDIRIDIQYSDDLSAQKETVIAYLGSDPDIEKYAMYRYGYVQYQNAEGLWEYLRVESGDESVFPLSYLEGSAPAEQTEMALSYLNASELGLKTVDNLKIKYQGEELTYTISGIYQDITYGGKTAKAAIDFKESDVEVSLDSFSSYISELYRKTPFSCGGHWLMINIKDKDTLNDVKRLLSIRVKPKLSA
jgi:putative ABC transport system permease protein